MNKPTTSGDDLLILARRGELSEPERRRLDVCLGASPLCRVLYELGVHYDTAGQDRQNDSAMIERAIGAVCERRKGPKQRRRRRGWLIGIVAALSSVSAAAAGVTVSHWVPRTPAETGLGAQSGGPAASRAKGSGASRQRGLAAPPANASALASATAAGSPHGDAPRPLEASTRLAGNHSAERTGSTSSRAAESEVARMADLPGTSHPTDSAARMFSEANTLRKAGRRSEAEQAYRRLQRVHAGSPEASVSHVLLGRILLREGRAAESCAEFEQYLRVQSRGNLAEEALQGNAMCARALGRLAAERTVWQRLLARFPGSMYADAARERLNELDSASGSLP